MNNHTRYLATRHRLFELVKSTAIAQKLTQAEYLAARSELLTDFREAAKNVTQHSSVSLLDYCTGAHDGLIEPLLVFRYCIDGEYYSIPRDAGFPRWDTLPRCRWAECNQDTGGTYWRDTNEPWFLR